MVHANLFVSPKRCLRCLYFFVGLAYVPAVLQSKPIVVIGACVVLSFLVHRTACSEMLSNQLAQTKPSSASFICHFMWPVMLRVALANFQLS